MLYADDGAYIVDVVGVISAFSASFCATTNSRESVSAAIFTAVSDINLPTSKLTVVEGKITLPLNATRGSFSEVCLAITIVLLYFFPLGLRGKS